MITHTKKSCNVKTEHDRRYHYIPVRILRLQYVFSNWNHSTIAPLFMGLQMYHLSTPPLQD